MNSLNINKSTILITGCAGFIGGALALRLVNNTLANVIGIDNMNDYYDVNLKKYRLNKITESRGGRFTFIEADICDKNKIFELFTKYSPDIVIHLAAQAGVRYSIENPDIYVQSNIIGFYNMLEACRYSTDRLNSPVKHFLFASSSSVYGNNTKIPYSEEDNTDHPISLYAATKKSNEIIAYSYANLYRFQTTGMRFFTVYGPAGRPDMAYYKFAEKLVRAETIELYNEGKNKRDFTYIDDVIDAIEVIIKSTEHINNVSENYRIYNIGNENPLDTKTFVNILKKALIIHGVISDTTNISVKQLEKQLGDVNITFADTKSLYENFGVRPKISIEEGLNHFAKWFKDYMSECRKNIVDE